MDVLKVSAAEFQRNVGRYLDLALRQPVAITRNGRENCVLLSTGEYHRLKRRDRQVLRTEDLTDEELNLIAKSEMPSGYEHLNDELKDWTP